MATEGADLSYWSLGDGNGLVKAIQHPRKAQSAENEAVTVQSVSKVAVMSYGLATVQYNRCEETGTSWRKAPIDKVSSYLWHTGKGENIVNRNFESVLMGEQ